MANYDDLLTNDDHNAQQGAQPFDKEKYAAEKKAEREELYARLDATTMSVAADPAAFRQYLDLQSRLGRYTVVNTLLVLSKNPEAERVGDLNYWRGQKVFIKTKELKNPIKILEPGDQYRREDGNIGTYYNIKQVYDISQAERKILPPPQPKYDERQMLLALLSRAPVRIIGVPELPDGGGAKYDEQTNIISIRKGMEFSDTFRCVAQELAYADLISKDDVQADADFSAYCASYILCKKYGIDTQDFDFTYAPAVFEDMDAMMVKAELSQIRAASDAISGRMEKHFDAISKSVMVQEAR